MVNLAAINSISFSIEMPWWGGEGFREAEQTEKAGCLERTEVTEWLTSQDDELCVAESKAGQGGGEPEVEMKLCKEALFRGVGRDRWCWSRYNLTHGYHHHLLCATEF